MSENGLPVAGQVIEASVNFTGNVGRRRCLVTQVKRVEIEGKEPFWIVLARFQTSTGRWSAKERTVQPPYEVVPS